MKIQIKSIGGSILFEGDFSCLSKAVEAAVGAGADLRSANLRSADLSYANLSSADLSYANLSSADLSSADLRSADLRYVMDALPVLKNPDAEILNTIKNKKGALEMGSWHTCETTHCRAGWYIHQSGPAGRMLEAVYGASVAGAIIFTKAYPKMKVPDFVCSNDKALADITKNAKAHA